MKNNKFMDYARKWKTPGVKQKEIERTLKQGQEEREKRAEERKANLQMPESEFGKQKENGILTLESKVEFSKNISNELILEANGQKWKYIGYANGLHFSGRDIRGKAYLERYDSVEKIKIAKKRISWFPSRTEKEEVKNIMWNRLWCFEGDSKTSFFTDGNKPCKGYESYTYRGKLKSAAANNKVDLSDELFEAVFGPIDEKLIEMHHKFYKKENDN